MTMHDRGKLLRRALLHFTHKHQISKAIEELGELITAIGRYDQNSVGDKNATAVIEEIADVKIMMDQLALIFGPLEVQRVEQEKLERLAKTIGFE